MRRQHDLFPRNPRTCSRKRSIAGVNSVLGLLNYDDRWPWTIDREQHRKCLNRSVVTFPVDQGRPRSASKKLEETRDRAPGSAQRRCARDLAEAAAWPKGLGSRSRSPFLSIPRRRPTVVCSRRLSRWRSVSEHAGFRHRAGLSRYARDERHLALKPWYGRDKPKPFRDRGPGEPGAVVRSESVEIGTKECPPRPEHDRGDRAVARVLDVRDSVLAES